MRPPLHALLVALVLGALSAFAVACGSEREGLISASRASELQDHLDAIDRQVAAGQCNAVDGRLDALRRDINDLPGSVDRDLRERLREGLDTLDRQAPEECEAGTETTPTQTTTTPETVPTETTPTETTPTETAPPTETTPPPTTTPETTPPETTPAPEPQTEPPPPSGGEEAPSGAVQEGTQG